MSRGGRGGGRGGRGGARGGRPQLSWDTGEEPDSKPSELFPPYRIPVPRQLTESESASVKHFLLLRHQLHASPLYTAKRTQSMNPTKSYGTAQANAQYDVKNKASVDPFTSMPTYGQRFVRQERALPDWSRRPVCRELWPQELLDTVASDAHTSKKRKLEISHISALPTADEAFEMLTGHDDEEEGTGGGNLLEKLDAIGGEEGEGVPGEGEEDEAGLEEEEEDEAYDDEDAGDYDAENYFDNGDEMGEDYGDDGDGEGTF
ncbi:DNA-directed RNA polymerase III, subunit Rpc31 [Emericellopsis atlantica]|uniref:DNA-directed RNA polymerase III subunit n=1 Tax=Emericellopsis atlantica TaxID=2614577 RepID=A0A9P7ZLH9_9HYPO|nr:DNA-directed RNA polymerase III, subunit Rpc31 [Emericellopsis atlantica]KAG9254318.1 DNA-directed RNA polymerase III, subunit Rpc31 [Emericellopsis atlantica]